MEDEKLFEALDKFPETIKKVDELADAVEKNNKTTTDNVAAISRAVSGQNDRLTKVETQLSALSNSITAAKNQMQKEVTVKYPPIPDVKIKHSDFTVYAEHTDAEMEKVADKVAEKVFNKKTTSNKGAKIILALCFATLFVWAIKLNNDYRDWMDRAISIGIIAGDMHPGDRGISVKEEFEKGFKERKAKKAEIKVLEEKYNKNWQNNARVFKNAISGVIEKDVVVLDFSYADVDSTSYNALVIFRLEDSEVETRAHICRDGNIYLTQDKDINTVQEADKYFRRKSWHRVGNRFDNDK